MTLKPKTASMAGSCFQAEGGSWTKFKLQLRTPHKARKCLSHNYRMSNVGRDHSVTSGAVSLLKQAHPRAHSTGLCLDGP